MLPAAAGVMVLSGRHNLRPTLDRMRAVLFAWPLSTLLAYLLLYRTAWHNDYLHWYWSNSFLALSEYHRIARTTAAAHEVIWGLTIGNYRPPVERFTLLPQLYSLTGYLVAALSVLAVIGMVAVLRAWRPWQSVLLIARWRRRSCGCAGPPSRST